MENKIYDKIELIIAGNGSGILRREFIDAYYRYVGNSLIIFKSNTEKGESTQTNDVFSLEKIIKFKCTENVKKES